MPDLFAFIWGKRINRLYLYGAIGASIALLVLFKLFYPYPNLVMDSYYYLRAASANADVNAWPIGYSRFLQLIGMFTHSHLVLVGVQYLFLELCLLLLFFTLRLFFPLGRLSSIFLFLFFFVNPMLLYTSNLVMADALFNGLSILWITQLLWIIFHPRPFMILTHALLLVLAFTVRYNALYYPFISILAFLLSRQSTRLKLIGIGLPLLMLGSFIVYTSNKMEAYCGVRQLSPFGGWKLANDALYMYAHVQTGNSDTVPARFQALDSAVRSFYATTQWPGDLAVIDDMHGSPFMFSKYYPLVQYMYNQYGWDTTIMFLNIQKWSRMGPLYADYGSYLIKKYPVSFARYFLWPNCTRYFLPPEEIYMTITPFYLRGDDLGTEATRWFGITTLRVPPFYMFLRIHLLSVYPLLFCLLHLSFLLTLFGFSLNKGWKGITPPLRNCLIVIIGLWLTDLLFSLTAAAIVLRYQLFMATLELPLVLFFTSHIYRPAGKPLSLPFQKSYDHDSLERLPGKE